MNCPMCGEKAKTIDVVTEIDCTYRRKKCTNCGHNFFTEETDCNPRIAKNALNRKNKKRKKKQNEKK